MASDSSNPTPGPASSMRASPEGPMASEPNQSLPSLQNETHRFEFTGSGSEYFRIWIVNLCLSLATLGIYSAWAKIRRLQYFHRNTTLAGAVFDFHGDPKAILNGRLIAVALLVTYHFAFGFSKAFGIAVVVFLLLSLPFMLRSALRFRLHNTSYRGLRFNFCGSLLGAYRCYFPVVMLFVLPALIVAIDLKLVTWLAAGTFILFLLWPLFLAWIKRYQHSHLSYGTSQSSYSGSTGAVVKYFYTAIVIGLGTVVLGGITASILSAIVGAAFKTQHFLIVIVVIASMIVVAYCAYLLSVPYLQVRISNLVWSNTRFPAITICSNLVVTEYMKLQAVNVLLTVLTLGLYRPFAVVRAYRYRLAHTSLTTEGAFDLLLGGERQEHIDAVGEGAADFFGFDLSW